MTDTPEQVRFTHFRECIPLSHLRKLPVVIVIRMGRYREDTQVCTFDRMQEAIHNVIMDVNCGYRCDICATFDHEGTTVYVDLDEGARACSYTPGYQMTECCLDNDKIWQFAIFPNRHQAPYNGHRIYPVSVA